MGDVAGVAVSEPAAQTVVMARFARWAAIVGVGAGTFFLLYPEVDLNVAEWFYVGDRRFTGEGSTLVPFVRYIFMGGYVAVCCLAVAGIAMTWRWPPRWLSLDVMQWMFVALCLALGPGLVANVIFKDNWGRARPKQVLEFDGAKPFSPALVRAQNCHRNCSFVSGEASSTFVMFFAAAALFRRRFGMLTGAGIVFGGLTGLMRMAQGAHFSSDVIFAGVFMALTVAALFFAFEAAALARLSRRSGALAGGTSAA